MKIEYEKIVPWHSVEKGLIIGGNGDVTIGFNLTLPEVYTLSDEEYINLNDRTTDLFRRLPIGTCIQRQDVYFMDNYVSPYTEKDNYTQRANLKYYDQRPVLKHVSKMFVTFSQRNNKEVNSTNNSFLQMSDFLGKKPFKDVEKNVENAVSFRQTILNSIEGCGLQAISMDDDLLLEAMFQSLDLDYATKRKELPSLQPMEITDGYLKYGNKYIQVISLVSEPNHSWVSKTPLTAPGKIYGNGNHFSNTISLSSSMAFPISLGLPVDHIVNTSFEIMDNEVVFDSLKAEARGLSLFSMVGSEQATTKRKNILFSYNDQKSGFLEIVAEHNYKLVRLSQNVIVYHSDKAELSKLTDIVQLAYTNMDSSRSWVENKEAANIYWASQPGNAKANYRTLLMPLENALTYMPWETHYRGDVNGFLLVDRMGNPLVVNLWNSPYMAARNGIIIGPTGSGKSFYVNAHIDMGLYTDTHYVVIDIGGSYKKLTALLKGKYYDSQDIKTMSFNVFLCPKDEKGKYLYMNQDDNDKESSYDRINFILAVIIMVWKKGDKVGYEVKVMLKESIINFYDNVNETKTFPDFTTYYEFMKSENGKGVFKEYEKYFDATSFFLILKEYIRGGQYANYLNSQVNLDLTKERFVVFDLQGVANDKEVFNLLSLLISELFMDKMRRLPGIKKSFLIDEGLDFLVSDIGDFIAGLYRKARKSEGQVMLATQSALFLDGLPDLVRDSITQNLDLKILLDHSKVKNQAYPEMKRILSLTDKSLELLDSLENKEEYREILIMTGTLARVFRINVSPRTGMAYSSWQNQNTKIYEHFSKIGNMESAINQYMEDENK